MTLMRLQQDDPPRIGRYLLTARLGAGGMGIVYLGKTEDGRQVAVKVLRPEHADDPETRKRFKREATAIARVRSPNAVQVLDADPDCETPYLATEFADGPSLEDHVKTYGPMHPEALVRLGSALAGALAAIHAADVTHRDLKPSNVLLTNTGPKVIDFGIARVANTAAITKTGMTIGSPGYMAPEQVSGHSSQKSDIFAWALVMAFAASGRPPFGTGPALTVLHRILDGPPDVSAVPPGLMPLVKKAIAEDPERRPTAAELLRELSSDPADLVTPADLAGAGAVAGAGVLAAAAAGEAAAAGQPAATGEMAAAGDLMEAEPGAGTDGSSGPRRAWRAAAVAVPVVAAMVAAEVILAQSGVQRAVHPSGHGNPRPAVARTPLSRNGDADLSGNPGSVAGSGVPGTPSGGASPSSVPHPASSHATSHPVSTPSSGPASSTAPSPSSPPPSSPGTAPSSPPPSSPSTTPSSTPPSSPSSSPSSSASSSTAPSSASPSLASPSASSSGSGSTTPSASSS